MNGRKLTQCAFYAAAGIVLAIAASAGSPANAATPTPAPVTNQTTPAPVPDPGVLYVIWQMPSWVNTTTPTWPQTEVGQFYVSTNPIGLNSAEVTAEIPPTCGTQYQVDGYHATAAAFALANGGTLTHAGEDSAVLISWRLVKNPTCIATPSPAPVIPTVPPKTPRTTVTVAVPVPVAVTVPTLASTGSNLLDSFVAGFLALLAVLTGITLLVRRNHNRYWATRAEAARELEPDLGIIDENEDNS
jgi:hypothetical protein